jgi:hypothetical protein
MLMSRCTWRLLAAVLAVALTLSLAGAAFAAPTNAPSGTSQTAPQGAPQGGPGRPGKCGGRRGGPIRTVAEYLGVTPEVVRNELKQGKTLAQIAVAHGKTRVGLRDALIAAEEQRLTRMTQGELKLTADEVKVLRGIMTRKVDLLLDKKWQAPQGD